MCIHAKYLFKQADATSECALLLIGLTYRTDYLLRERKSGCLILYWTNRTRENISIVVRAHTHTHMSSSFCIEKRESPFLPRELFTSSKLIAQLNEDEWFISQHVRERQSMLQIFVVCLIFNIQSELREENHRIINSNDLDVLAKTDEFVCPKNGRWPHPLDCEK